MFNSQCLGHFDCHLRRRWLFLSPPDETIEVPAYAPGVVGETPVLAAGQSFQYMSTVRLKHNGGTMEGEFLMEVLDTAEFFPVTVAKCQLRPLFRLE